MHTIELSQTPNVRARQATLEVRALTVRVKPPNDRNSLPVITHNVILVREVNGPGDGTDVEWLLMTTLPIDTVAEILCVLDYYVARWTVETYFRTLKTGCQVEKIQLETKPRLLNCLALYNIIAWRILYLVHLNRTSVPQRALHGRLRRSRMETRVAHRQENKTAQETTQTGRVPKTAGSPGWLQ